MKVIKYTKPNFRTCPCCKSKKYTSKYRDEERVDGMICNHCQILWNVDWELLIRKNVIKL